MDNEEIIKNIIHLTCIKKEKLEALRKENKELKRIIEESPKCKDCRYIRGIY